MPFDFEHASIPVAATRRYDLGIPTARGAANVILIVRHAGQANAPYWNALFKRSQAGPRMCLQDLPLPVRLEIHSAGANIGSLHRVSRGLWFHSEDAHHLVRGRSARNQPIRARPRSASNPARARAQRSAGPLRARDALGIAAARPTPRATQAEAYSGPIQWFRLSARARQLPTG